MNRVHDTDPTTAEARAETGTGTSSGTSARARAVAGTTADESDSAARADAVNTGTFRCERVARGCQWALFHAGIRTIDSSRKSAVVSGALVVRAPVF